MNGAENSFSSPALLAALQKSPLILKILLDHGADPFFEDKLTHNTIIGTVLQDYDFLMENPIVHPIVTEKLNKLVMIAAIMQPERLDVSSETVRSNNSTEQS